MSNYSEAQTQFTDGELLLEALTEKGFQPRNCIGNPQPLEGHQGDYRTADGRGHTTDANQAMKADIILPRSQVGGASNDIGFVRGADGKFSAIVSDYDSRRYNGKWMQELKASYADKGIMRQAKRAGLRVVSRKPVKGQIQYEFLKV